MILVLRLMLKPCGRGTIVIDFDMDTGCGADAAPYFRIFNPILQGEKFDKEGKYVKKWVPELNRVPSKFIHKPWDMELEFQQAINTLIGKDYPKPIVIHEDARASALNAFQSLKKN